MPRDSSFTYRALKGFGAAAMLCKVSVCLNYTVSFMGLPRLQTNRPQHMEQTLIVFLPHTLEPPLAKYHMISSPTNFMSNKIIKMAVLRLKKHKR